MDLPRPDTVGPHQSSLFFFAAHTAVIHGFYPWLRRPGRPPRAAANGLAPPSKPPPPTYVLLRLPPSSTPLPEQPARPRRWPRPTTSASPASPLHPELPHAVHSSSATPTSAWLLSTSAPRRGRRRRGCALADDAALELAAPCRGLDRGWMDTRWVGAKPVSCLFFFWFASF